MVALDFLCEPGAAGLKNALGGAVHWLRCKQFHGADRVGKFAPKTVSRKDSEVLQRAELPRAPLEGDESDPLVANGRQGGS